MTLQEFFDTYPITKQGIADLVGMKRELLADYVRGKKKISIETLKKIEDEINQMGFDISNVTFNQ